MIDEFPILAVAAACAEGQTIFEGVSELRFKESDRLDAIAKGLNSCGVEVEETKDKIIITSQPKNNIDILENKIFKTKIFYSIICF